MPDRPQQLAHLDYLGDATKFSGQIHALIPKCNLLENFSHAEVRLLSHFMDVYMCAQGVEIIREGEGGDFMLMIIEGRVEVLKRDRWNTQQLIAVVDAGKTLGEMSMIDGEPRFATCMASQPTTFAVLTRDSMAKIILDHPSLGSKILVKMVTMLSLRLRQTSARLLRMMEEVR